MESGFLGAERQRQKYIDYDTAEEEKKEVDNMPIAINSNRPPSAPPNGNGGNGTPRTTTSRRGGRTRSRSPPVVGARGEAMPMVGPSGNAPENPSSAAAAAAAAAKNFSGNTPGGPPVRNTWPESGEVGRFVEKQYTGSRQQWPGEDYGMKRYPAGGYGPSYRPHPSDSGGDYGGYRPQRYDGERKAPSHYGSSHSSRYHPQDMYRYDRSKSSPQQRNGGGTSLVLGGATPIHLPKRQASYDRGSAASVFRGRPDAEARPPSDDDSPQKILLSLKTPTTSFEDKGVDKSRKGLSLSPTDPPQIQNSNQGRQASDPLFEPQKSGLGVTKSGSIEMAGSFTLFNQSFDSFGDGNYFHVGSNLQNDSFGVARAASGEVNEGNNTQILHKSSSVGNASQLIASGSGALTIGYSPVNSFGHNSTSGASRRGDMVLGGARSSSPSQVLNIYRSYSGGRPDMLEDSHLRMSVGSFGAGPTASYGAVRPGASFGEVPPAYFSSHPGETGPHFYVLLRRFKSAFKECTFLLPGLKSALLETPQTEGKDETDPHSAKSNHIHQSRFPDPSPHDTVIARRRVESSICAFGGNLNRDRSLHGKKADGDKDSIFRGKTESDEQKSVTVTPSSSVSSPPASHSQLQPQSQARRKYEEALQGRYYENDSRLSWEFEENPPVEILETETVAERDESQFKSEGSGEMDANGSNEKSSSDMLCQPVGDDQDDSSSKGESSPSPQPKMRYRCKLCGQPKQNHRCPYQQSLARSIGIMVFPAVNAFTAAEPGSIATPLEEMNNFTDTLKDGASAAEDTPNRPTPDRMRRLGPGPVGNSTQVTPESLRTNKMSPPFASPQGPGSSHRMMGRPGSINRKRSYAQVGSSIDDHDLLFVDTMELKHEQFRVIAESKPRDGHESYTYPTLPLPYAQRKKLSDNLFSLSNEVPKLTDECAQVLREAREKDLWDLAVAELMTQVIVILHCPDGDNRFDGLRTYLLTLGIAC